MKSRESFWLKVQVRLSRSRRPGSDSLAFEKLAEAGILLRLDDEVKPTMYRCATITESEFKELQGVTRVVRKGHVLSIDASGLQMEHGSEVMPEGTVYVNCTADGLAKRPIPVSYTHLTLPTSDLV